MIKYDKTIGYEMKESISYLDRKLGTHYSNEELMMASKAMTDGISTDVDDMLHLLYRPVNEIIYWNNLNGTYLLEFYNLL